MRKIFWIVVKELLLLRRDKAGLLMLFMMPALLVVVITLVQENVMELTGQKKTKVLFLDLDAGSLGRSIRSQLEEGYLQLVNLQEGVGEKELRQVVASGKYQAGIILSRESSKAIQTQAASFFQNPEQQVKELSPPPSVEMVFDPGIMPSLKSGLRAQLQKVLMTIGMQEKISQLEQQLTGALEQLHISEGQAPFDVVELAQFMEKPLITLHEEGGAETGEAYNPVEQNVPAWALFGMFFTALPIAGALLQERQSGIWVRLCSLPVSLLSLLLGRILAYCAVCLSQFFLIVLVGAKLFPLIGLPAFLVSNNIFPLLSVILCAALAASSFGLFFGAFCRTYEQAMALGATFIVLGAALGGVMVPVYAMPELMQRWSSLSPLNWGLTAFHDLSMRGASLMEVSDNLGRLLLCCVVLLLFAWKRITRVGQ